MLRSDAKGGQAEARGGDTGHIPAAAADCRARCASPITDQAGSWVRLFDEEAERAMAEVLDKRLVFGRESRGGRGDALRHP